MIEDLRIYLPERGAGVRAAETVTGIGQRREGVPATQIAQRHRRRSEDEFIVGFSQDVADGRYRFRHPEAGQRQAHRLGHRRWQVGRSLRGQRQQVRNGAPVIDHRQPLDRRSPDLRVFPVVGCQIEQLPAERRDGSRLGLLPGMESCRHRVAGRDCGQPYGVGRLAAGSDMRPGSAQHVSIGARRERAAGRQKTPQKISLVGGRIVAPGHRVEDGCGGDLPALDPFDQFQICQLSQGGSFVRARRLLRELQQIGMLEIDHEAPNGP